MSPFLPRRLEPAAFALLLTCFMTCMVSGITTLFAIGLADPAFWRTWFKGWMTSWVFAFPIMLVAAPVVRRILRAIVVAD